MHKRFIKIQHKTLFSKPIVPLCNLRQQSDIMRSFDIILDDLFRTHYSGLWIRVVVVVCIAIAIAIVIAIVIVVGVVCMWFVGLWWVFGGGIFLIIVDLWGFWEDAAAHHSEAFEESVTCVDLYFCGNRVFFSFVRVCFLNDTIGIEVSWRRRVTVSIRLCHKVRKRDRVILGIIVIGSDRILSSISISISISIRISIRMISGGCLGNPRRTQIGSPSDIDGRSGCLCAQAVPRSRGFRSRGHGGIVACIDACLYRQILCVAGHFMLHVQYVYVWLVLYCCCIDCCCIVLIVLYCIDCIILCSLLVGWYVWYVWYVWCLVCLVHERKVFLYVVWCGASQVLMYEICWKCFRWSPFTPDSSTVFYKLVVPRSLSRLQSFMILFIRYESVYLDI